MSEENNDIDELLDSNTADENVFSEIMDSFYSLTEVYSNYSATVKDESRKKAKQQEDDLEMQSIREDIERRYNKQFQNAIAHSEAPDKVFEEKAVTEPDPVDISEELNSLDNLLNGIDTYIIDAPHEKKETAEKPEIFDLSGKNSVFVIFYTFGDYVTKFCAKLISSIFKILLTPFKVIVNYIKYIRSITNRNTRQRFNNFVDESKVFRAELKGVLKNLKLSLTHPKVFPSVIKHYAVNGFKRHNHFIKTCSNLFLPIAAALVLISVLNYQSNLTFALEVFYNGESVGCISDESVLIEAQEKISNQIYSKEITDNAQIKYGLSVVSLNQMEDSDTISEKIINSSAENLTSACGVYVDNKFICAVKNEADAKTVFYSLLEPYEQEAAELGYSVSFAQSIDYVQGLYPDNSETIWETTRLENELKGEGTSRIKLDIKKIVTTTTIREIKYSTVKQRDLTKYSGYRLVKQAGQNGTQRVTSIAVYINDVYSKTEYNYETITEPVDEIVVVGSMTSYNGVYIGEASAKGFLWPAPHCRNISSKYGWRSSGWHKGIDLCTTNNTAYGSAVIAARSGVVEAIQRNSSGYGHMILINHGDGYKTRYAHLVAGSIKVSVGEYVEAGRTIGKVGSTGNSTGPHLHFEVIYNGETKNPINYIK